MNFRKLLGFGGIYSLFSLSTSFLLALAAPPVRIAVVPGGGSGMEQEVVDRISGDLSGNGNIVLSTVNPDWFVSCNVLDRTDVAGGSVRVNGTVTIKSIDGQVLNTVSMQTNKQDFSLQPGTPPNKMLFDNAVREVVNGLVDRARQPLLDAVEREIATRDRIIDSGRLASMDRYQDAIALLSPITPDTPHFKAVRQLMATYQMENSVLEALADAQEMAKRGKLGQAIQVLKPIPKKSKRFGQAQKLIADYQRRLTIARRPKAVNKPINSSGSETGTDAQLKALDAQKKALNAQMKAVEAQQAALKGTK